MDAQGIDHKENRTSVQWQEKMVPVKVSGSAQSRPDDVSSAVACVTAEFARVKHTNTERRGLRSETH